MKRLPLLLLAFAVAFLPLRALAGMRMTLIVIEADKIAALQKDPDKQIAALQAVTDPARVLDIDKMWHGIHYLLTGSAGPVPGPRSSVIFGGKGGGGDLGYGPARLLTAAEVKEIAKALKEEPAEKLSARYDPKKMKQLDIYPDIWVEEGKEALDDVLAHYRMVAAFYAKAAASGSAVLLILS